PPPPSSTPFPYTTLFRSIRRGGMPRGHAARGQKAHPQRRSADHTHAFFRQVGHKRFQRRVVQLVVAIRKDDVDRRPIRNVTENRSEEHTSELQSRVDLVC